MGALIRIFLFDEQVFTRRVRPALDEALPTARRALLGLLEEATNNAPPAEPHLDPATVEERLLEAERRHRRGEEVDGRLYVSGRAHPGRRLSKDVARRMLAQTSSDGGIPAGCARAVVDHYCVPWHEVDCPIFDYTHSPLADYLRRVAPDLDAMLTGGAGSAFAIASDWVVLLLRAAEARPILDRARALRPPRSRLQQEDLERLTLLLEATRRGFGLIVDVSA